MITACDPHELRDLAKSQSPEALERIAVCYLDRLRGVGRCACGDAASAEDAVQDALVSALKNLGSYRGEGSVEAWMATMVVNACRVRRRGRKHDPAWNLALDETVRAPHATDHCAARAELVEHLARALAALPERDRWLYLMSEQEGRGAPELAATLAIEPAAVRARLTRIRKKLRTALAPVWDDWRAV